MLRNASTVESSLLSVVHCLLRVKLPSLQMYRLYPVCANRQNAGAHEQPSGGEKKRTASRTLRRQVLGFLPGKRGTGESDDTQIDGLYSFVNRDEETATPWLPEHLHGRLASRLSEELFGKAGVRMGVEEDLDQYESAFEFAPAPDRYDKVICAVSIYSVCRMGGSRITRTDVNTCGNLMGKRPRDRHLTSGRDFCAYLLPAQNGHFLQRWLRPQAAHALQQRAHHGGRGGAWCGRRPVPEQVGESTDRCLSVCFSNGLICIF